MVVFIKGENEAQRQTLEVPSGWPGVHGVLNPGPCTKGAPAQSGDAGLARALPLLAGEGSARGDGASTWPDGLAQRASCWPKRESAFRLLVLAAICI